MKINTRTKLFVYTLLCIILFSLSSLLGQKTDFDFDRLDPSDGLSSQLCRVLVEDDLSNIWIGTFNEVNKYNGYSIKNFYFKPPGKSSFIEYLSKDKNGNIWVLFVDHQENYSSTKHAEISSKYYIVIIDPLTDRKLSFKEYVTSGFLKEESITKVFIRESTLYFLTKKGELYSYSDELKLETQNLKVKYFLGMGKDATYYQYENDEINEYSLSKDTVSTIHKSELFDFRYFGVGSNGSLFLAKMKADSVHFFRWDKGNLEEIRELSILNNKYIDSKVLSFYHYKYHSGQVSDLAYLDGRFFINGKYIESESGHNFDNSRVNYFIESQNGLIYIATDVGVFILKRKKSVFKKMFQGKDKMNSTRGIIADDDLICARNGSLEYIESPSKKYNLEALDKNNVGILSYYRDPINEDILWSAGWFSGFIRKIDLGSVEASYCSSDVVNSPIYTIIRSKNTSRLYAGGDNGFYIYNDKLLEFKRLDSFYEFKGDRNFVVNHMINIGDHLFLATNIGILKFDETVDTFELIVPPNLNLPFKIQFIHVDQQDENIFWLGTAQLGMWKYHILKKQFESYDTSTGLSNNSVHSIYEDMYHRLWLSTNRNLNCFTKEDEVFHVFTLEDGIANSEFNKFSFYENPKNGNLYLGGLNGYTYFNPDSIKLNSQDEIKVRLLSAEKIKVNGEIEDIFMDARNGGQIEIFENDVKVDVKLSTNHLFKTKNIVFSYRIPSISEKWETINSNKFTLSRLPYGNHTMEIVSDRNKSFTSSAPLSIDILVAKPFYKKGWFVLGSILSGCFLIVFIFKQRLKIIKNKNLLLEETVAQRTKELSASNQSKNKLFAILAHDLRSPISSLTNLTKKINFLVSRDRIDEVESIAIQTEKRVVTINDNLDNILIWALTENGTITNNPVDLDLRFELLKVQDLYESQIKDKNIIFKNLIDESMVLNIDRTILQTIFRNALNNAIKFCKENSEIKITTHPYDDFLEIRLINEFNPSLKEYSNPQKGTGIGLKICNELAELSGGKIDLIINDQGKTYFTFKVKQ